MEQLIPVSSAIIGGVEVLQTVNARDLHSFLEVGKDFSNWIKSRINQYGFVENQEFVCTPVLASNTRGGHNRNEYHLTLDMAKELAMVERNEKGKQARQYFIALEKLLRERQQQTPALPNFMDPVESARAWADAKEAEQKALAALEEAKPAVEFVQRYVERSALQNATQVAQTFGMSAVTMNKRLDEFGGVYNKAVKRGRAFCQDWIDKGLGEMKQTEQGYPQALFTTKGAARVHEIMTTEGVI